jgi:iron-sulfur cluster assembly accessory protein
MEQERSITLSDRAVEELKDLFREYPENSAALRVWVAGGGCSGLTYGMAVDDQPPEEKDHEFTHEGIRIVVDPLSYKYIAGSNIDYVDELLSGGFKVDNPNSQRSCGCGTSFTPKDNLDAELEDGGCGGCSMGG